jgi:hypothetical protein
VRQTGHVTEDKAALAAMASSFSTKASTTPLPIDFWTIADFLDQHFRKPKGVMRRYPATGMRDVTPSS